jgi:hypothetical protein
MNNFLIEKGYNLWKTEFDEYGTKEHYQIRADRDARYKDYPLCNSNDHITINITHSVFSIRGHHSDSYTAFICLENKEEEWCNIEIYGISEKGLEEGLDKIQLKLLNMWKAFNE